VESRRLARIVAGSLADAGCDRLFGVPGGGHNLDLIGAALTGRRIVCFTGGGGLEMCLAELETAARLALPITVVVFNDASLSLIEIKQVENQGGRRAVRFSDSDFAAVARGLGAAAGRAASVAELGEAFAGAVAPRALPRRRPRRPGQLPGRHARRPRRARMKTKNVCVAI
jgi:thiamine pyrophosphate-dependent acetolactate synthase large subunit-like protein